MLKSNTIIDANRKMIVEKHEASINTSKTLFLSKKNEASSNLRTVVQNGEIFYVRDVCEVQKKGVTLSALPL
jgi:hypothetical protein